jgi:hypothetical protein
MKTYDTIETHAALKGYDHPDAMVTLKAPGKRLTKLVTPSGVEPADDGFRFEHDLCDVGTLDNLFDAVADLSGCPDEIVVRGAVIEGAGPKIYRRHRKEDPERSLIEAPRRWVMVDVDRLIPGFEGLPPDWAGADIRAMIRAYLPPAFHKAGCVVSWSSSMGTAKTDDGMLVPKVHLFFLLDRPTGSDELKHWLDPKKIDASVFSPSQPHYTAAPIFDGGKDPVGERRVQRLDGPRVEVPETIEPPAPAPGKPGSNVIDWDTVVPWRERLERWTEDVGENLHDMLRDAAWAFVNHERNHGRDPDFDVFRAAVLEIVGPKVDTKDLARREDRLGPDLRRSFDTALARTLAEEEKYAEAGRKMRDRLAKKRQPTTTIRSSGEPLWEKLFKERCSSKR